MDPEQCLPGIYRLSVPTPYPVGPMNCYLLDGPEPVLVDCGPPTAEGQAALRAGLAGLRLAPRDLAQIVLTHHHPDHAGGLSWLRDEAGAPVLGHRRNDAWLLGNADLQRERRAFFSELARYCGVQGEMAADLSRRYADYDRPFTPRGVDAALQEGDEALLAGHSWRVLETPGHAGSSISLLRADDGATLVGDTLLDRISSNALVEPPYGGETGRTSSLLAYRRTLQRLAQLPLGLILPGHGPTFREAGALISRRLQSQQDRARRLLEHLAQGDDTALALVYRLFPGLPVDELFLGLSEVLGHLDLLEDQALAQHSGTAPARYTPR